jgi:hypothetical protein
VNSSAATLRSFRRRACALGAVVASLVLAPVAAAQSPVQIHARCTGDLLSGSVRTGQPGDVELKLLAKRDSKGAFTATGRSALVHMANGRGGSFSFDVGRYSMAAYRVDSAGSQSNVVPIASCAPGHQVPEAPAALLLPLTALLAVGATLARRRFSGFPR